MQKFKEFFSKSTSRVKALCATASAAAVCGAFSPTVLASGGTGGVDADELVGKLVEYIFKIFFYIGVLLLAWAIGQLVLAFKNEDADSKSRAMMLLVVAIILMGIQPLFSALNLL